MTKLDLDKKEIDILLQMLGMVQVKLDEAPLLMELRRKLQTVDMTK